MRSPTGLMKPRHRNLALIAGVAAVYFLAARLGLSLAFEHRIASPVWPPSGLALAAVLLLGRRVWPGIALGAFLANASVLWGSGAHWVVIGIASVGVCLGNTAEALIGAWLVERYADGRQALSRPATILWFVLLAGFCSSALSASDGMLVCALGGFTLWAHAGDLWLTWWFGDAVSIILIAPLILAWTTRWRPLARRKRWEAAALFSVLIVACQVVFGGWLASGLEGIHLPILLAPVLVWIALRFGRRGTTTASFIVVCFAVVSTFHGNGPFAVPNPNTSLLLLQNFIIVVTVLCLLLAAEVENGRETQAGLRASEQRYRALSELGRRLSAASKPKDAARIIVEIADTLFGWDACVLDLSLVGHSVIETVFCVDTINGQRTEVPLPSAPPGAFARNVLKSGARLVLRPEAATFDSETVPFGDAARPSRSLMYVPLRAGESAIGIFSIQSYKANAYTETDLRLLQSLADHCGGALERIRAQEEIQRLNRQLRRHLEELQTIFDVAPVGLAVARDPDCRVITGNPACQALLRGQSVLSQNGAQGNGPTPRILRRGREVPAGELPMQFAARHGIPVRGEEIDLVFEDGLVINSLVSASPLYDETGRVRGSLGVLVDLSERKRAEAALQERAQEILRLNEELERRVLERTAQLEAINKELEAFSYSVSHDLRAPLRSIRGFSEVLLERYTSKLDGRGQEFLRRSCESSRHMDKLIEALLQLSRVSRCELQPQTVNLSALAVDILAGLQEADPGHPVRTSIAPALLAKGDERLLRVLLDNLLRNAWKFTAKQTPACIEFGQLSGPDPAFFVRDNGAGFDMAYAGKLFGVFQRLHSTAEFPGTGVGLATVQRIINRHRGRIWVEAATNQGATFFFTLPGK